MASMKTIQVTEPRKGDFKHKGCGGDIMCDASVTQRLPMGFGFRGGKFVIDTMVRKGWRGQCDKCMAEGAFFVGKATLGTKVPRGINAKINARHRELTSAAALAQWPA